jgi:hypothetical protein
MNNSQEIKIEDNLEEIVSNINKMGKKDKLFFYSEQEKNKNDIEREFLKLIDEIDLSSKNYRSIFVDGKDELIYDNGEFFICSAIDFRKPRKKKTRKEATDLYIEYFIKYQLNPLYKEKQLNSMTNIISKGIEKESKKNNINIEEKNKDKKINTKLKKSEDKVK